MPSNYVLNSDTPRIGEATMDNEYLLTPFRFFLHRRGTSPFCEQATEVRIEDEGGGAFIVLAYEGQEVRLDPEEIASLAQMLPVLLANYEDEPVWSNQ